ncbi:MAG: putative HTH-type transcriptional regulator YtcD [Stenotrophomonas maltophilia]|uniref:Putative HTH-type transcriptional regulator YtcD n=1 Tax=Stenotrophomonas maltophilia TaxID=40324 RepID=A0A7V8FJW2_STEMA|nr:MAG: putative HTH-type transcriptional regulator YtcD [Stenotrophomonas maltophilia]
MIPDDTLSFDALLQQSQQACDALSDEEDGLKREILGHADNRWSLGVVHALGVHGALRQAELARQLPGVTQRMLTHMLRQLQRDGLITRHDHDEVPPRVDYALTALGRGLLMGMVPLWRWVIDNAEAFREARERFKAP